MLPIRYIAAALWLGLLSAGCGGKSRKPPVKAPASTVPLGTCADPSRDGVLSEAPELRRADRDLDGDRDPEAVVADEALCTGEGNCYWNLYAPPRRAVAPEGRRCWRYLGTVAASAIDLLELRGEEGFYDLRGWWTLTGGGRLLLQHYRYRHGGYQVVEAMVCRQEEDDRLLCAREESEAR